MPRKPHWLSPPGKTKTPRLVVSFDTETASSKRGPDEILTLRCWDALVRSRPGAQYAPIAPVHHSGESPASLANVLQACADVEGEAWAFAHNLGFDLTVTSLPMILSERGWETDFVSLGDEACVFVLKRDGAKLVITDSWSWLRAPLSDAARDVGRRPVKLPANGATLAQQHKRCSRDVEILDATLVQLMDWWDAEQLGGFGITGAACGWRSLRALSEPKTVLVGPEPPRTAFERRALYSGRKEVWQVGEVKRRWVADYDLVAAHLTTCAHLPLPVVPLRDDRLRLVADPLAPPQGVGTLCEVEITTRVPCAPVKIDGDVWWPTGTFRTVLSSPELVEVCKAADSVRVLQARWYRLGAPLAPWAQWCLGLLDPERTDVPAVVRRVAKGWGRSVPGRFALRVSTLIGERPATHLGWAVESGTDLDTGDAIESVTYGGIERTYRKDQDGSDVFPAVLAFVEGHVRAAMATALAARDPDRLLQCNTDGWWEVCRDGVETIEAWEAPPPFLFRRAAHERGMTVIGPNHVQTPGERRLSGVPKDARPDDGGGYVWQDWPGLRWQLEFSRPGEYVRPRRGMILQPHYCRRWVLDDGETVPAQATVSACGQTELVPWSQTGGRDPSDRLATVQVPALELLRDASPDDSPPPPLERSPRLGRRWRSSSAPAHAAR